MKRYPFTWNFLRTRSLRAENYLAEGDRVACCALAGAVIETSLRHILEIAGVHVELSRICPVCGNVSFSGLALGTLIQTLEKKKFFNKQLKNILQKCRRIRNTASHGHFGVLTIQDCKTIIQGSKMIIEWGCKYFPEE